MTNKTNIAIVIPVYNEEKTIEKVIKSFFDLKKDLSIYVIDNNSNDRTLEIVEKTSKDLNITINILSVEKQGKANAVREALRIIDSQVYVLIDGDNTYSAHDLDKLIEPVIKDGVDMVVGNRFTEGGYEKENKRIFHNFGNKLVRRLINFLYKSDLKDIMSGYRALSRKFVKNFPIMSEGFELETEMTLHCLDKKFKIKEVPISYKDREAGSFSKLSTFKDGFKILKTIFIIFKDYKPLLFFSALSFLSFIFGIGLGILPIYEFIKYQYVYKVPTAILATGFIIISLILFAIALILDTVSKYQRFNFEMRILNFMKNDLDGL